MSSPIMAYGHLVVITAEDELHERLRSDGKIFKDRQAARERLPHAMSEEKYRENWLIGVEKKADDARKVVQAQIDAGHTIDDDLELLVMASDRRRAAAAVATASNLSSAPSAKVSNTATSRSFASSSTDQNASAASFQSAASSTFASTSTGTPPTQGSKMSDNATELASMRPRAMRIKEKSRRVGRFGIHNADRTFLEDYNRLAKVVAEEAASSSSTPANAAAPSSYRSPYEYVAPGSSIKASGKIDPLQPVKGSASQTLEQAEFLKNIAAANAGNEITSSLGNQQPATFPSTRQQSGPVAMYPPVTGPRSFSYAPHSEAPGTDPSSGQVSSLPPPITVTSSGNTAPTFSFAPPGFASSAKKYQTGRDGLADAGSQTDASGTTGSGAPKTAGFTAPAPLVHPFGNLHGPYSSNLTSSSAHANQGLALETVEQGANTSSTGPVFGSSQKSVSSSNGPPANFALSSTFWPSTSDNGGCAAPSAVDTAMTGVVASTVDTVLPDSPMTAPMAMSFNGLVNRVSQSLGMEGIGEQQVSAVVDAGLNGQTAESNDDLVMEDAEEPVVLSTEVEYRQDTVMEEAPVGPTFSLSTQPPVPVLIIPHSPERLMTDVPVGDSVASAQDFTTSATESAAAATPIKQDGYPESKQPVADDPLKTMFEPVSLPSEKPFDDGQHQPGADNTYQGTFKSVALPSEETFGEQNRSFNGLYNSVNQEGTEVGDIEVPSQEPSIQLVQAPTFETALLEIRIRELEADKVKLAHKVATQDRKNRRLEARVNSEQRNARATIKLNSGLRVEVRAWKDMASTRGAELIDVKGEFAAQEADLTREKALLAEATAVLAAKEIVEKALRDRITELEEQGRTLKYAVEDLEGKLREAEKKPRKQQPCVRRVHQSSKQLDSFRVILTRRERTTKAGVEFAQEQDAEKDVQVLSGDFHAESPPPATSGMAASQSALAEKVASRLANRMRDPVYSTPVGKGTSNILPMSDAISTTLPAVVKAVLPAPVIDSSSALLNNPTPMAMLTPHLPLSVVSTTDTLLAPADIPDPVLATTPAAMLAVASPTNSPSVVGAKPRAPNKRSSFRWIHIWAAWIASVVIVSGLVIAFSSSTITNIEAFTTQSSLVPLSNTCHFTPPSITAISHITDSPTAVATTQTPVETNLFPADNKGRLPSSGDEQEPTEGDEIVDTGPTKLGPTRLQNVVDITVHIAEIAVPAAILLWWYFG